MVLRFIYMLMMQNYSLMLKVKKTRSFRLQKDIDSVVQWMEMWLLRLNTTKCKAMTYGRGPAICTSYSISSDVVEKIESINIRTWV